MRWLVLPLVLLVLGALALVAGNGGSDDEATVAPETQTETTVESRTEEVVSPRVRIRLTLEEWAALFAAGASTEDCPHMTQPLCERIACRRVSSGPIENCTPPSPEYRKSFEDATVVDVVQRGNRAAAGFSNGEAVELFHATQAEEDSWLVNKLGGSAGRAFFESD